MFKNITLSNNCPYCRNPLEKYGEEDNYPKNKKTVFYICRNCGFERKKYGKLKNEI